MIKSALGLYPIDRHNREDVYGYNFVTIVENEQIPATVFVFEDSYKKIRRDIVFTSTGQLYISDCYGSSMDRNSIFYVKTGEIP